MEMKAAKGRNCFFRTTSGRGLKAARRTEGLVWALELREKMAHAGSEEARPCRRALVLTEADRIVGRHVRDEGDDGLADD